MYSYKTQGTCSRMINFDIENGTVHNLSFVGGCNGNLQGISRLVEGLPVDDVISLLEGVQCGKRPTSCPDQLAQALKASRQNQ